MAIILIVILFTVGKNNSSNKQDENKSNTSISNQEKSKSNKNVSNTETKTTTNVTNIEISLTRNEAKMLEIALKDDIKASFSSGESLLGTQYIFTTAKELQKIYSTNEARGDKTFKNKEIIITGVVESISSGIGDMPVVHLKTNEMFKNVSLHFDIEYQSLAIDLNKNQKVSFYCQGDSVIIGTPTLSTCKPVEIATNNEFAHQLKLIEKLLKRPDLAKEDDSNQIYIISFLKYIGEKSNDFLSCKNLDINCLTQLGLKYKNEREFKNNFPKKMQFLFKNHIENTHSRT